MDNSVFRVIVDFCRRNYVAPWDMSNRGSRMGSSFCMEYKGKKHILTNYHVVTNAEYVTVVYKNTYCDAVIDKVIPEFDIAIIHVDKQYMDTMVPLKMYPKTVHKGEEVRVLGFPLGMDNISLTEGVVSQINSTPYSNFSQNIVIQIDAAISNGNSGGPVIKKGSNELIGIAFSSFVGGQNLNCIIPNLLINKGFEKDYDSVCTLAINHMLLLNNTLREYYGLHKIPECKPNTGILVKSVTPFNHGIIKSPLKVNDVLLSIDGHDVTSSGMVSMMDHEDMLPLSCLTHIMSPHKDYEFVIVRDGKLKRFKAKLPLLEFLVPPDDFYFTDEYVIIMGIVFVPVSDMLIRMITNDPNTSVSINRICSMIGSVQEFREFKDIDYSLVKGKQDVILASDIIYNDKNKYYSLHYNVLVSVNKYPVFNIRHVVLLVTASITAGQKYIELEFDDKRIIVLDISEFKSVEAFNAFNKSLCLQYINTDRYLRLIPDKELDRLLE